MIIQHHFLPSRMRENTICYSYNTFLFSFPFLYFTLAHVQSLNALTEFNA